MSVSFCIWKSVSHYPNRLDVYLCQCFELSRNIVKRWFEEKKVLDGHRPLKPSHCPQMGCEITVLDFKPHWQQRLHPSPELCIPILFKDPHIIVCNKPRGISVNALRHNETHTVANFLLAQDPNIPTWDKRTLEPGLVHRLDQWTSGCLVGVRTAQAYDNLKVQFQKRRVKKIYLALVEGSLTHTDTWTDDIIHDPKNIRKMRIVRSIDSKSKTKLRRVRLSFSPIETFNGYTFVEIQLHTGRMHQIRAQFSHRGYPLVGDTLYGASVKTPFEGQWLHAHILSFSHPVNHHPMIFRSPLPETLAGYLDAISNGG